MTCVHVWRSTLVILMVGWVHGFPSFAQALTPTRVLLVIPDQYGANLPLNMDSFREFGWQVTTAAVRQTVQPCRSFATHWGFQPITVDQLISETIDVRDFDVLAIGPSTQYGVSNPYGDLLQSASTLELIREAVDAGLVVYASCAGVRVLAAAGVLQGVRVTGHDNFRQEISASGAIYVGGNHAPVIDGNIVTTTRDGGYVLVGNTDGHALMSAYGMKMDSEAVFSWEQVYVESGFFDFAHAVQETQEGHLLIAGVTKSPVNLDNDGLLIEVDPDGRVTWSMTLGQEGHDWIQTMHTCPDGGVVVAGSTSLRGATAQDIWVTKLGTSWTGNHQSSSRMITHITRPDGGFNTTLLIQNEGNAGDLILQPSRENGERLPPVTLSVPEKATLELNASQTLGSCSHFTVVGSETCRVTAAYTLQSGTGLPAHVHETRQTGTSFVFYPGPQDLGFDGFALVNAGERNTQVRLYLRDRLGQTLSTHVISANLAPNPTSSLCRFSLQCTPRSRTFRRNSTPAKPSAKDSGAEKAYLSHLARM